jgi:pyruvate ferredoxin oxidoreductase delta subunit
MPMPQGEHMQKPAARERKRYLLGPVAVRFTAAKTGTWRILRPVYDAENCTGCRLCEKYCPAGILELEKAENKGDNHNLIFNWEYCKGCGVCMTACARHCIEMQPERDFA